MIKLFCKVLIIAFVLILHLHLNFTECSYFSIAGLEQRLEQFEACNTRITAKFNNMELEAFSVPLTLLDVENRKNLTFFEDIWGDPTYHDSDVYLFKYREAICTLDLICHLGHEPYEQKMYWHDLYQINEYMLDKYLVIIRHELEFLTEDQRQIWDFGLVRIVLCGPQNLHLGSCKEQL